MRLCRIHIISGLLTLAFGLSVALGAYAAPGQGKLVRKKISVMPVQLVPKESRGAIKNPEEPPTKTPPVNAVAIRDAVTEAFERQPEFYTQPWADILGALETDRRLQQGMTLAKAGVDLGTNQYRNLNVSEALESLKRAAAVLHEHLGDLRNPNVAAELYLHLGLSYLEQEKMNEAFAALRSMYHYTPARRFQSGFYPTRMEDAIRRAYIDFLRSPLTVFAAPSRKYLGQLRKSAKLDHAIGLIHRADSPDSIEVHVVDIRRKATIQQSTLPLNAEGTPDAEALDRMVSRFVACDIFERIYTNPRDQRAKASFVSAHSGHHTYFKHPTRSLFHSLNMGLQFERGVSRYMAFYGGASLLSSVEDQNRNLSHQLLSARIVMGTQLRVLLRKFTLFFAPGLEVNMHSGYTVLTSVDCKYFGTDHPRCNPDNVKVIEDEVLAGITTTLGARYHINKDTFVGLETMGGFYVFPQDRRDALDLPLTVNASLGFRL